MLLKFAKKNKVSVTFLSLLVLSFLLMSLDVKKRGRLSVIEEFIIDSASAVQRGIAYSIGLGRDAWFGYVYLIGQREENLALRGEAAGLKERLNALREVVQENKRLKELLAFKETSGYHAITARVIGTDPTSLFRTITIGAGSSDGVRKGMAVVTSEGVVGRVINSSSGTSRVLLATDRNSDIDAVIQRSRDRGIAEGAGPDTLHLKYMPRSADVVEGDMVVTSGIGGIFPKGLVIGSVSRLDKTSGGIFLYAEVRPSLNFSKLEEVLVITESPGEGGR
jgi:rod shape-determining protein MreC